MDLFLFRIRRRLQSPFEADPAPLKLPSPPSPPPAPRLARGREPTLHPANGLRIERLLRGFERASERASASAIAAGKVGLAAQFSRGPDCFKYYSRVDSLSILFNHPSLQKPDLFASGPVCLSSLGPKLADKETQKVERYLDPQTTHTKGQKGPRNSGGNNPL